MKIMLHGRQYHFDLESFDLWHIPAINFNIKRFVGQNTKEYLCVIESIV